MVVRPGGAPYAGGRPRTVPSGLVRPEDLGIVIDASACRRQRSLLGEPPGQLFGVELTDRVVDGGAIVGSTSRLVSSAITALAGPQDDSSSNAPLELGQGHVELDDHGVDPLRCHPRRARAERSQRRSASGSPARCSVSRDTLRGTQSARNSITAPGLQPSATISAAGGGAAPFGPLRHTGHAVLADVGLPLLTAARRSAR